MLKQIVEFFTTGILLIVSYLLYFITAILLTFILGLPVAIGIKMVLEFIQVFFRTSLS